MDWRLALSLMALAAAADAAEPTATIPTVLPAQRLAADAPPLPRGLRAELVPIWQQAYADHAACKREHAAGMALAEAAA